MRGRDGDRRDMSTELLGPKDRTPPKTAADVKQVSERTALELPRIRCVFQHPLLRLDQLRPQRCDRGQRFWVIDEARVIVHTRSGAVALQDRKSTRLNSSHDQISYAVFC